MEAKIDGSAKEYEAGVMTENSEFSPKTGEILKHHKTTVKMKVNFRKSCISCFL